MEEVFRQLFEGLAGEPLAEASELSASGSHRRYFRLRGASGEKTFIGVLGSSQAENEAFFAIGRHFASKGIRVPEILAIGEDSMTYIVEDLGDDLLFDLLAPCREKGSYDEAERRLLCKVIGELPKIQFEGAEGFDFSACYPQKAFGERLVNFDLNYFKYCFLKATGLEFNEVKLQDDFDHFREDLLCDTGNTFMYRDFQARNVMIRDGEPYFIDFQGGMRGPVYYDVASFVWQARARYPEDLKQELLDAYLSALKKYMPEIDEETFRSRLRLFLLFRILQTLGAYGFRGYFEKKPHFLASVPAAIDNLRRLLRIPFEAYPYLNEVLTQLTSMPQFYTAVEDKRLEVTIYSFAYKKGIPVDESGNGGGYVFDCRGVNNPGKYEYYRQFTGMDAEVIKFLEDDGEVTTFLGSVYSLVDAHVARFIERKFTHLSVCFGCTGGQHRSVYCAEHLASHLAGKFDVKVRIIHRELDIDKTL